MKTDRRTFVKVVATTGGALLLGVRPGTAAGEPARDFRPGSWVRIGPDGIVTIIVGKTEMGQGVRTSLPLIVAEELDVPLQKIRIEQARPGPDYEDLGTGGSSSVEDSWMMLRYAGATARAMLVGAAAAKWGAAPKDLQTDRGSVIHAATGRSLPYGALVADASRQPVPERPPLKPRASFRQIGKGAKRVDGPDIVTGRARYGIDARVPGMLFAVVAHAPQLGAAVGSFDPAAAMRVRGVKKVVQIPTGVAVIADNSWAAMRGRDALRLEWGTSPNASFDSREHMKALEKATAVPGVSIRKDGAGGEAVDRSPRRMEAVYSYPFEAHAAVEPVNCTVLVENDRATIWSPTQAPNSVHAAAAQILGIPQSAITVNVMLAGGAFGRRLGVDFDREAVEIARQIKGTPVQLLWTRADDMRYGYFQAASVHRMRAGLDEGGRLLAWEHRKASTPHNARRGAPSAEQKQNPDIVRGWAWGVYNTPYAFPAAEMSYAPVDAPVPIGPWRAVFSPSSVFARECFLDEVAQATGTDPIELRLRLLGKGDDSIAPVMTVDGERIDRPGLRKVLELVAAKSGWSVPPAEGRARGVACSVFHTGTLVAYVVEVSPRNNPAEGELPVRVERIVCAVDCGLAVNPNGVAQQVESGIAWSLSNMKSEITLRGGAVEQANFSDFPVAMIGDIPPVEIHIVDSGEENPRGLGEPTVCPFAPAVVNAMSRLVGTRVRSLPL